MKKALLVIDMQRIIIGQDHHSYFKYDEKLVEKINEVISENEGNEIVYIRNLMKHNLINNLAPFKAYEGTKEVELVDSLVKASVTVFDKYAGDAFSNPKLDEYLRLKEVDTIEVVGVDGGGCVGRTALGAQKKGYQVIVNTKGIGTMFEKKRDKFFNQLKVQGAKIIS